MNDKEIILAARKNDSDAVNEVIKQHEKMIYKIVGTYKPINSDFELSREDMFQEGLIGLFKAVHSFDLERDVKFSTYAFPIINRFVYKEYQRQYSCYINECYSYSKFDELDRFGNQRSDCVRENPIDYYETKTREEFLNEVINLLNDEDKMILKLRLNCYSYKEISERLNISVKKIDYRLRKIKKLVNEIKNNYYPN